MDMVRQYMKEEEVRAHHQSSLLRLRQKALKEKTKAELAWLEHQKRHRFTFIRIHVVQMNSVSFPAKFNVLFSVMSSNDSYTVTTREIQQNTLTKTRLHLALLSSFCIHDLTFSFLTT